MNLVSNTKHSEIFTGRQAVPFIMAEMRFASTSNGYT